MLGVLCAMYAGVVALLVGTASLRSTWELRAVLLVYNAAQVVLCGWMAAGLAAGAWSWSNPMALNLSYSPHIEFFMLLHFLSKILDFCDTIWMVLKKNWRQLTFLHVYHHLSITLVWGYLLQSGDANGTAYFGAFLNSVVHFLMYSHYFVTSLGYKNPLKPLLTNIQLLQFGLCLLHAVLVALYEKVLPANLAYLQLAYHTVMLILFGDFKRKQIRELAAERKKAAAGKQK